MDRIENIPILKQMYGVINDMNNCWYNASKGAKKSKVSIKIQPNWKSMSKDYFQHQQVTSDVLLYLHKPTDQFWKHYSNMVSNIAVLRNVP